MEFLKKHYEKIILSAVLLGLGATAFWLSVAVDQASNEINISIKAAPKAKPWKEIDLTAERAALASLTNPPPLVLSGAHNLLNPVTWKVMPNGVWRKFTQEGVSVLVVTNISPVYMTISFADKAGEGFHIVVRQGSAGPRTYYAKVGEKDKTRPFAVTGIVGVEENPSALKLELPDGETAEVSTNQPYRRVIAHEADLKYDPDAKTLTRQRVDDLFSLSQEPYKIIEVTNNAVTVQNTRTTQKTTIPWTQH